MTFQQRPEESDTFQDFRFFSFPKAQLKTFLKMLNIQNVKHSKHFLKISSLSLVSKTHVPIKEYHSFFHNYGYPQGEFFNVAYNYVSYIKIP